jgi:hypothetical protein
METWKIVTIAWAAGLALGSCVLGIRWACHVDYKNATVAKTSWVHATDLRQRTLAAESDWGRPPSGAGPYNEPTFNHKCQDRANGTYCCRHEKDKDGNQVCSERCIDYDLWCSFEYWEWPVIKTKTNEGDDAPGPYPSFGLEVDDNHREKRWQLYTIFFNQSGDIWSYQTRDREHFSKFVDGDPWEISVPRFGDREPTKRIYAEAPQ